MKIAVIGGGVSGATFAINRKRKYPSDEIVIFEHCDKLLKKVLATGNGKCNIANKGDLSNIYNDNLALSILNKYNYAYQNAFLDSINIKTKLIGDLSYPISESAVTVRNAYLKMIEKLDIKVITEIDIEDYKQDNKAYLLITNKGNYKFDKIVIAVGGKSSPKLGSDGSFINILEKHKYNIKSFNPGLCPIYVKEKTKILDGTRVKAKVTLLNSNNVIFEEQGELLFKGHGLSGIVIFNLSRNIARDINKKYQIKIDLLPEVKEEELKAFLNRNNKKELLESYLHPNIAKYIGDLKGDVISNIKGLCFEFDKLYDYENSQISVGGINLKDINDFLESNIEKSVYFLGECLDIDAPCGGYNLMWAIGSALYLSDTI